VGRASDHWPNFDLVIGRWAEGASAADRSLVSLEYRLLETSPAFRLIDAAGRPPAESELVGQVLRRSEVVGQPIAQNALAIADAVLAQDGRLAELLGSWRMV